MCLAFWTQSSKTSHSTPSCQAFYEQSMNRVIILIGHLWFLLPFGQMFHLHCPQLFSFGAVVTRREKTQTSSEHLLTHAFPCPTFFKLPSHRTTELLELEGILKGHLLQLPCSDQGHPQLNQVAYSLVQPGLDCLQGWASITSLGNLFLCLTASVVKTFSLYPN